MGAASRVRAAQKGVMRQTGNKRNKVPRKQDAKALATAEYVRSNDAAGEEKNTAPPSTAAAVVTNDTTPAAEYGGASTCGGEESAVVSPTIATTAVTTDAAVAEYGGSIAGSDQGMTTYVNLLGKTVTQPPTSHDMAKLDVLVNLDSVCLTISVPDKLELCYKTLTNGFIASLLNPSNARALAYIQGSQYYSDLLKRVAEFALTEIERLENEWSGFMRHEHMGFKAPVRSGELAQVTVDLVRLFGKLRVGYAKYFMLKQYKAWEKEFKAWAVVQAKVDAMRVPVPGATSVITVR